MTRDHDYEEALSTDQRLDDAAWRQAEYERRRSQRRERRFETAAALVALALVAVVVAGLWL